MRLFGLYKGRIYFIDTVSTNQGFAQYREVTPAMGYNPNGFGIALNDLNMDLEPSPPESWYTEMSAIFRGSHAVLIDPTGNIHVQNKWFVMRERRVHLFAYMHGNLNIATNQWYSDKDVIVSPFVAMLKYYNPEEIDVNFIEKIRFMEHMHEVINVHSISFDDFTKSIQEFLSGSKSALEAGEMWSSVALNKPITVVDIDINTIPQFNAAEVVYWNTWLSPKDSQSEEVKENKTTKEKGPRLVEDVTKTKSDSKVA